jgi:hypothetical protein
MKCKETDSLFEKIKLELDYVESTLAFLSNAVENGLDKIENDYNNITNEFSKSSILPQNYEDHKNGVTPTYDDTWESELNYLFSDIFDEHNNITSIIIQSILIKQNAILEKALINLSLLTYHVKVKDHLNQILPPNYKKVTHYTDAINAVEYMEKHLDIKIKSSIYWEEYTLLRNLRHLLAHGNNSFVVNKNKFSRYKNKFTGEILCKIRDEKDTVVCQLSSNFLPLIDFNKNMVSFIDELKKYFVEVLLKDEYAKYIPDDIPF